MFDMLKVGSVMRMSEGDTGRVVANMTTGEFSQEFTKKDWGHLERGILVNFVSKGLVEFPDEKGFLQEFFLTRL